MTQPSLFAFGRVVVCAGATGNVTYDADCATPTQSAAWFHALRESIDWRLETRRMYDRDVGVPRLTASFRLDDADLPPALSDAAQLVASVTGAHFTSVGLNFYRD